MCVKEQRQYHSIILNNLWEELDDLARIVGMLITQQYYVMWWHDMRFNCRFETDSSISKNRTKTDTVLKPANWSTAENIDYKLKHECHSLGNTWVFRFALLCKILMGKHK